MRWLAANFVAGCLRERHGALGGARSERYGGQRSVVTGHRVVPFSGRYGGPGGVETYVGATVWKEEGSQYDGGGRCTDRNTGHTAPGSFKPSAMCDRHTASASSFGSQTQVALTACAQPQAGSVAPTLRVTPCSVKVIARTISRLRSRVCRKEAFVPSPP